MAKFNFEDENEDEELEGNEEDTSRDEPFTGSRDEGDHDSRYSNAENEGVEDAVIESLVEKEDITLDDLRSIPGSERLTDEELESQWQEALKKAGLGGKNGEEDGTQVDLPFPVYDAEGNKVAKDKVTMEGLLDGSLQLGYNAMGKEQRKSINDVIRNASQGHWNEHRYNTVQGQLQETTRKLQESVRTAAQFEQQQNLWNGALTALLTGDRGPMQKILDSYRDAITNVQGQAPKGFVSEDSVRQQQDQERAGMEYHQNVLVPEAYSLAQEMGANPKEVLGAIEYFINNETHLTQARLEEIIKYEVPMAFEQQGYSRKATQTQQNNGKDELAEMRKELDALKGRTASDTNKATQRTREKQRSAPPAGSGGIGGAGDSMPHFKSRSQFKAWSQDDPDWKNA